MEDAPNKWGLIRRAFVAAALVVAATASLGGTAAASPAPVPNSIVTSNTATALNAGGVVSGLDVKTAPAKAAAIAIPPRLNVSGIGSGTLWFSRSEMAWWATAGTAAVVAGLVAMGVPGITVWGYAGTLIATFWTAYWSGYCAWFTYRGRISMGTYRC